MKYACVGNTGKGKTLAIVVKIIEKLEKDKEREAYCNFHIHHPRAHYTPVMFLPFSRLKKCIICFDDIDDESELKRFIKVCAKRSRKEEMDLMFTCQYYTMIPRKLRKMIDFRIFPSLDKEKDILTVKTIPKERGKIDIKHYNNIIKKIKKSKVYDTNEVIDDPTESDIINEIAKISYNERDIEKNLMLYTGNRALRKQLFKEILEICDFNKEERETKAKEAKIKAKEKKLRHQKQKTKLIRFLVKEVDLNSNKDSIYGRLLYKTDEFNKKNLVSDIEFNEIIMRSKAIFSKFDAQISKNNNEVTEDPLSDYRKIDEIIYYHCIKEKSFRIMEEILGTKESTLKYHYYKYRKEIKKWIKEKCLKSTIKYPQEKANLQDTKRRKELKAL